MFRRKNGQSTAEYAIVIGLVIAAALAMQTYVKRGLQAKIRGVVDYKPGTMFTTGQFEPDYSYSDMDTTRTVKQTTDIQKTGEVTRSLVAPDVTKKSGTQKTSGLTKDGAQIQ